MQINRRSERCLRSETELGNPDAKATVTSRKFGALPSQFRDRATKQSRNSVREVTFQASLQRSHKLWRDQPDIIVQGMRSPRLASIHALAKFTWSCWSQAKRSICLRVWQGLGRPFWLFATVLPPPGPSSDCWPAALPVASLASLSRPSAILVRASRAFASSRYCCCENRNVWTSTSASANIVVPCTASCLASLTDLSAAVISIFASSIFC